MQCLSCTTQQQNPSNKPTLLSIAKALLRRCLSGKMMKSDLHMICRMI